MDWIDRSRLPSRNASPIDCHFRLDLMTWWCRFLFIRPAYDGVVLIRQHCLGLLSLGALGALSIQRLLLGYVTLRPRRLSTIARGRATCMGPSFVQDHALSQIVEFCS
jgi:hypothetical protein